MTFKEYAQQYQNIHLPRFSQLPKMELYSDQLITYLQDILKPLQINPEETLITTAMVNNYVKLGLIEPTKKKRYNNYHIAYLIVICVFKQLYAINKINEMIKIQSDIFTTEVSYDYFCQELENALANAFSLEQTVLKDSTKTHKEERLFVRATCNAFANKLLVVRYLDTCIQKKEL